MRTDNQPESETLADALETRCCIVGGGPAGVMLALLLARHNVPVVLLEAHKDFDRDFRGDTIHPSTLEILDQLGLADRLLELPHGKVRTLKIHTAKSTASLADLSRLKTRFPYIAIMPQVRFLDFLASELRSLPSCRLIMGATAQRLVEANGSVEGVRYRDTANGWHEVRAGLTVGVDGRFSKLRSLAGFEPVKTSPPMDVVWMRLPRSANDPKEAAEFFIGGGHLAVVLDRGDAWQIAFTILKGGFPQVKAAGMEAFRKAFARTVPWLADRVETIRDWKQLIVLAVESNRLPTWHKPGLLLLGDAAHAMSPVGGVGINYAIQDAVEAANLLGPKLIAGRMLVDADLAEVQRVREGPTRTIQRFQTFVQNKIVSGALKSEDDFRLPWFVRLALSMPYVRNFPAKMIAWGPRRVRVEEPPH